MRILRWLGTVFFDTSASRVLVTRTFIPFTISRGCTPELPQALHASMWLTAANFEEDRTVLDAAGGTLIPGDKL